MQRFKRYIALALTLLYLVFSGGVPRSMHFCGGELASEAVFAYENDGCCCEVHHPDEGSCCSDVQELEKVQDEHSTSAKQLSSKKLALSSLQPILPTALQVYFEAKRPLTSRNALAYRLKRPPPPPLRERLLRLGSLRISGDEIG
jgi:hypothetical protein